jgi:hypothetical protein
MTSVPGNFKQYFSDASGTNGLLRRNFKQAVPSLHQIIDSPMQKNVNYRQHHRTNRLSAMAWSECLEPRQLLSATINFAPHVDFTAGTLPIALVAADFNSDGNEDLAVADNATDKVSVFFGNGAGAFSAGPVLSLSSPPVAMITGDFNGDGKPDIAVACTAAVGQSTTSVVVFLNTGNGTFGLGAITTVESGATPGEAVALAAGDFNGDGHLDLAVTDYTTESISILIGNGTGIFAAPDNYQADAHPLAIAEADFNGDTYPDLAVTSTITDNSSGTAVTTNNVSILVGSSTGDFSAGPNITVDSAGLPTSIAAGNFTGASTPGLVIGSSDGTATVLTNTSGSFAASSPVTLAAGSTAIAVGDFDLDGNTDFVSADGGSSTSPTTNSVTVVPGTGTGTLQFSTGATPAAVVVADFNNDGKPDIATANEVGGTVSILLNTTAIPLIKTTTKVAVSAASTPAGSAVTLTATITAASASILNNEEVPTGSINYYDGSTLLATEALASGQTQAVYSTSSLTVGTHKLRAVYSGDDAYSGSSSAAVTETITPTATEGPDLVGTFVSSTLPAIVAPGETGVVKIRVTNQGNTIATGSIIDQLYLSLDTAIDPNDTLLTVRGSLARANLHLQPNQSVLLAGTITIPQATPLASYYLLAALDATGSLAESVSTNNLVASPTTYAVSDVFGTVDGRKGVVLQLSDANGTPAIFKLTGPGNGTVNIGDDGIDVVLDQTTAASALTITTSPVLVFQMHNLTADSAIGSIRAATVHVSNLVNLPGGVNSLTIGNVGTAGVGVGSSDIILGGGTVASINIGTLNRVGVTANGGIRSVSVGSWTDGSINAAWITSLRSKLNLEADLTLTGVAAPGGVALGSVITGGVLGEGDSLDSGWQVTGNIGRISAPVFGSLNLNDTGVLKSITSASGLTATIDATAVGSIVVHGSVLNLIVNATSTVGSVLITGDMLDSTINAGINQAGSIGSLRVTGMGTDATVTAGFNTSPAAQRSDGVIKSIFFGGTVDSTSRFLAATLPKRPIINGVAIDTATDPRFQG